MAVYYLSIQRLLETILGRITAQTHSSLNNNKDSNHLMSFICIHRECMYYIPLQVHRPLDILYTAKRILERRGIQTSSSFFKI